ncbi:MAG: division/cell wall cluster transcriptional repressor MraZ [Gemmatimonadota bacterium]
MSGFLGRHLHTFDEKGRVSLPASFRRGRETEPFVLVHAHPDALSLYPEESWAHVEESLREMAKRRPDYRPLVLGITANAHEVTLDKQGRILVPDRLREGAGLGSEALIIGAIDRIEIWDPDRFEESAGRSSEEFDRFVASIFA